MIGASLADIGSASAHDWTLTPAPCAWDTCRALLYASHGGRRAVCPECGTVWGGDAPERLARSSLAVLRDSIRRRAQAAAMTEGEAVGTYMGLLGPSLVVTRSGLGEAARWTASVETRGTRRRCVARSLRDALAMVWEAAIVLRGGDDAA